MTAVFVFLGGALGAPLRYLTDRAVQRRHSWSFPVGTLIVNTLGSLLLGALLGAGDAVPVQVVNFAGPGLAGALTTYSTFSHETMRLLGKRAYVGALLNVLVTVLMTVAGAAAGFAVTSSVRC